MNVFLEDCQSILKERLIKAGLLLENGVVISMKAAEFQAYCYQTIYHLIYNKTMAEVAALDKQVDELQLRYNLVGSVEKSFYKKTGDSKKYRYLTVETVVSRFTGETFCFLDWLLAHHRYTGISEVFPAYWHELEQKPSFEISINEVAVYLSEKFQPT